MKSSNSDELKKQADLLVEAAQQEISRPEENVVAPMVCKDARQAIINYMTSFLLDNDITITPPNTIDHLLKQCKEVDGRFSYLNITPINCRFHTRHDDYCLSTETVAGCLAVAQEVKGVVDTEAPAY